MTASAPAQRLDVVERHLPLWGAACTVIGVALIKAAPSLVDAVRRFEFGEGSQIDLPIAVLIRLLFDAVCAVCNRTRGWFPEPDAAAPLTADG